MSTLDCPSCKTPYQPGARFCRGCGKALPPANAEQLTPSPLVAAPAGSLTDCPHCKHPNNPRARFCARCGKPLTTSRPLPRPQAVPAALPCPSCGHPNRLSAKHCVQCGKPIQPAVAPPPLPVAPPPPSPHITLTVDGDLSGNVAIGDNNFQVRFGNVYGGEVNVIPPEAIQKPQLHQGPVYDRPPQLQGLLDREAELQQAAQGLTARQPVELSGAEGVGKTSLLNQLAHHPLTAGYTDGVIYLPTTGQPVEDLLQHLFDSFYTCGTLYKSTPAEVRRLLRDLRVVLLFDDLSLPRERVDALLDALPASGCLLASCDRRLWRPGQVIELGGLPPDAALQLIERELGRSLTSAEGTAAQALIQLLSGHPLRLLQAVSMARRTHLSLPELVQQLQGPAPHASLHKRILAALSEAERRVVSALAALSGAPAASRNLAAVTGVTDITQALAGLHSLHLVQSHSPRYSLTGTLAADMQSVEDLTPWREHLLDFYTAWAENNRKSPALLLEEMDTLLQVLRWAIEERHWAPAQRLARTIQAVLALDKRWSAWGEVLTHSLSAARAMADRSAEAWALHQLGTRALCLGEKETARQALTSALNLREALGEKAAALVTRHNLSLIGVPPVPPKKTPRSSARPAPKSPWPTILAIGGGLLGMAIVAAILIWVAIEFFTPEPPIRSPEPDRPVLTSTPGPRRTDTLPPPPPENTPTPTSTPSPRPTFTNTPSPTITLTPFMLRNCINFEGLDYPNGTPFPVDSYFFAGDTTFTVLPLFNDDREPFSEGYAMFWQTFMPDGSANTRVDVNRAVLNVDFPGLVESFAIDYFHYPTGSSNRLNITINDDYRLFYNIRDLHESTIGRVNAWVEITYEDPYSMDGRLIFTGRIESFSIGAEIMTLDEFCPNPNP